MYVLVCGWLADIVVFILYTLTGAKSARDSLFPLCARLRVEGFLST